MGNLGNRGEMGRVCLHNSHFELAAIEGALVVGKRR